MGDQRQLGSGICTSRQLPKFVALILLPLAGDPPVERSGKGRQRGAPLTVVVADQSQPKSLPEMQALAAVANWVLHLSGRLGPHEELGRELAAMLG